MTEIEKTFKKITFYNTDRIRTAGSCAFRRNEFVWFVVKYSSFFQGAQWCLSLNLFGVVTVLGVLQLAYLVEMVTGTCNEPEG